MYMYECFNKKMIIDEYSFFMYDLNKKDGKKITRFNKERIQIKERMNEKEEGGGSKLKKGIFFKVEISKKCMCIYRTQKNHHNG